MISDETLMAFADGELEEPVRAAVEAAMREDPQIERRIAQHRALREQIQKAYALELSQRPPARLVDMVTAAESRGSNVIHLQDARERSSRDSLPARPARAWWRPVGSMAASVLLGLGLGYFFWRQADPTLMRNAGDALVARGQLATALSSQLSATQSADSAVKIGVSYLAKSGNYCRTFTLFRAPSPSGVACRQGREWIIHALTEDSGGVPGASDYRTAASAMPAVISSFVERQIDGEPLDEAGEQAAQRHAWAAADR